MPEDVSKASHLKELDDGGTETGDAPSTKKPRVMALCACLVRLGHFHKPPLLPNLSRSLTLAASLAGTRSVATLTPEQLSRQRANDREAQRNIRQRTNDHIESLQQRICDLPRDREDARNLEEIQMRNEELEEELKNLKDILLALEDDLGSSSLTRSSICMWMPFPIDDNKVRGFGRCLVPRAKDPQLSL
jgi:hypothetical protein